MIKFQSNTDADSTTNKDTNKTVNITFRGYKIEVEYQGNWKPEFFNVKNSFQNLDKKQENNENSHDETSFCKNPNK